MTNYKSGVHLSRPLRGVIPTAATTVAVRPPLENPRYRRFVGLASSSAAEGEVAASGKDGSCHPPSAEGLLFLWLRALAPAESRRPLGPPSARTASKKL